MEQAVERIVTVMRDRYGDRLYIPDLAAEAFFSPFHFSRIFRRETGVSPGQYLTAVRLFEAKRLLLTTSVSVADIACRVGYRGIGTFTTRFTTLVGVPPGHYRRLAPAGILSMSEEICRLPDPDLLSARHRSSRQLGGSDATIVTSVHSAAVGRIGRLFVGVFDNGVPQGPPVAWTVVPGEESALVRLGGVPAGPKVVIAVAEGRSTATGDQTRAESLISVSRLQASAGSVTSAELQLRRPRRTDPPIMIPLCNDVPVLQRIAT
ncbi:MAG: AraC family transcriptional regulator [Micromonosporaceae bacterium]|nr:AraC family transcriptional regulator [Micromonosporaceae bacterium]